MNKYVYICDQCGEECGTKEEIGEIPSGPDHFYGGAKWIKVEVEVSDCCGANFEREEAK